MNIFLPLVAFALIMLSVFVFFRRKDTTNPLSTGTALPEFTAVRESGESVSSSELLGKRAVILFVRGSWCPFCTEQVESLTDHYRTINEAGGRLIIVTPKPLDTTRRVADLFNVEFEFWLDADLQAADSLGLADPEDIPDRFQSSFGRKTMRPAVLVTDSNGIIRFSHRSQNPKDRPNPARFIQVFQTAT